MSFQHAIDATPPRLRLFAAIRVGFLVGLLSVGSVGATHAQLPQSTRGPYPTYKELTAALEQLTARAPELASMTSLAETPEGRNVWLMTVAARRDERPLVPPSW